MSKKTLRLASTRDGSAGTPARKAGVRMVKARVRSGAGPEAPAAPARGKPRESSREGERERRTRDSAPRPVRADERRPGSAPRPPRPPRPESAGGQGRPRGARADSAAATPERPRRPRREAAPEQARPWGARVDAARSATATPAAVPAADGPVRVSRLLAEQRLCSRREADEYIERGWVFADGERVTKLGTRVAPGAVLKLDNAARAARVRLATIVLHKPVGYVSGQPEDDHPPAVALIRPENLWTESPVAPGKALARFDPAHLRGLAPAGRLDIESTGLLVLTQDGTVARQLIGADSPVDKEYLVRVEGSMVEGGLERLNHGLELDGVPLRPARVEWLNDDQLRFVLREGRKRQIRRMCEAVGLRVTGLKRVRIGQVMLGDLPAGRWRFLGPDEAF